MSDERITDELAVRVFGWTPAPDRFLKTDRGWIPRWRFQPFGSLANAFQLLEHATYAYTLTSDGHTFTAEVRVNSRLGRASGELKPRVITIAVARALGLDVEANG